MKYIPSILYFILFSSNIILGVVSYTYDMYIVSVLMILSGILFLTVWFSDLMDIIHEDKENRIRNKK